MRFHPLIMLAALTGCTFDDHRSAELCDESSDCAQGRCSEGLCVAGDADAEPVTDLAARRDAQADARLDQGRRPDLRPPNDLAPAVDQEIPVDLGPPPPDADPPPDVGVGLPPPGDGPDGCAQNENERCWRVAEDVSLSHPDLADPRDAHAPTLRLGLPDNDRWRDAFLKFERAPFLAGKRPAACALLLRRAPGPASPHMAEVRAIAGNFSAENLAEGAPVPMALPNVDRASFVLGGPGADSVADVTAQVLAGLEQPRVAGIALRIALDRFELDADLRVHSAEAPPEFAAFPPRLRCSYLP